MMTELGSETCRMSALLDTCPKEVREQILLRLDEFGEDCQTLKAKVISGTVSDHPRCLLPMARRIPPLCAQRARNRRRGRSLCGTTQTWMQSELTDVVKLVQHEMVKAKVPPSAQRYGNRSETLRIGEVWELWEEAWINAVEWVQKIVGITTDSRAAKSVGSRERDEDQVNSR